MATPDSIFGAGVEVDLARSRSRSLAVILGVSVRLKRPKRSNHCLATQAIANAGKRALKVSLLCRGWPVFPPKRTLCDTILMGKKVAYT